MDKLTLVNKALLKVGLPLAAALNDCDWNAAMVFDAASEEVFRSFTWNFAQKYVSLGQGSAPGHGYDFSYPLPADCARVIDVHCQHDLRSPRARRSVVGKQLYTNVSPCNLRYVSKATPIADWPADFCDAVAARIALEIAPLSTQSASMVPQLMQLYQLALATAQAADARETTERIPHDVNIWAARAGEGVGKGA